MPFAFDGNVRRVPRRLGKILVVTSVAIGEVLVTMRYVSVRSYFGRRPVRRYVSSNEIPLG